jgi:hypothetical protein
MNMGDAEEVARLVAALDAARPAPPLWTFLTADEVAALTGRKFKSRQIQELRRQGIAFHVNATGHPVVARSIIDPKANATPKVKPKWVPDVLKTG